MGIFLAFTTGLLVLLTLGYLYSKWHYSYWKRRGVVQLEPEFFYGNSRKVVTSEQSIAEAYLDYYNIIKARGAKYGGLYAMFKKAFLPVHPTIIKDIMQKNFDHFSAHFIVPHPTIFTKGLFHQYDEPWKQARRKLTPTFTSGKMKMMFEILFEKSTGLGDLAGEIVESGEPANIREMLGRYTTEVIASCGFGIEVNALKEPDSDFIKYGKMIFASPDTKLSKMGLLLIALGVKKLVWENVSPAENFFKKIISETIDYREKNNIYRKDFMHLMIQLKNRGKVTDDAQMFNNKNEKIDAANTFDLDEVVAQSLIFFIAGYETSATTLTFALLELAQHQDIQDKVRQEVNRVSNKYNGKMTYEAMMELTYTEAVINETLRKHPPISIIPRVCTKDYTIPGTDIVVEKGTQTFIPALGLQRDPEYYPDPEKFDPERFSEENKKNIKEFTFLPFGEGPRMCIGLRFGMMQSRMGLFSLIKNYKFTLHPNTTFPLKLQKVTIIRAVEGDVWLNISKVQ